MSLKSKSTSAWKAIRVIPFFSGKMWCLSEWRASGKVIKGTLLFKTSAIRLKIGSLYFRFSLPSLILNEGAILKKISSLATNFFLNKSPRAIKTGLSKSFKITMGSMAAWWFGAII